MNDEGLADVEAANPFRLPAFTQEATGDFNRPPRRVLQHAFLRRRAFAENRRQIARQRRPQHNPMPPPPGDRTPLDLRQVIRDVLVLVQSTAAMP